MSMCDTSETDAETCEVEVRSDFVGKKLGLIRGRLVAVLAAKSTDSLPWIPL